MDQGQATDHRGFPDHHKYVPPSHTDPKEVAVTSSCFSGYEVVTYCIAKCKGIEHVLPVCAAKDEGPAISELPCHELLVEAGVPLERGGDEGREEGGEGEEDRREEGREVEEGKEGCSGEERVSSVEMGEKWREEELTCPCRRRRDEVL